MAETKKRTKPYFCQNVNRTKFRRRNTLRGDMKGVLVTCNRNENKAAYEAYCLMNEYAERKFGEKSVNNGDVTDEKEASPEDIADALNDEVKTLKATSSNEEKFEQLVTQVKNCVFIKSEIPTNELVEEIMCEASNSGVKRTRFCLRLIPVLTTCHADTDSILKSAEAVFLPYFQTPFGQGVTFSVIVKLRNNDRLPKSDVLGGLAQIIEALNPLHTVNCDDPTYTVLINVLCNICCISVVSHFKLFRKYNIHEIVDFR